MGVPVLRPVFVLMLVLARIRCVVVIIGGLQGVGRVLWHPNHDGTKYTLRPLGCCEKLAAARDRRPRPTGPDGPSSLASRPVRQQDVGVASPRSAPVFLAVTVAGLAAGAVLALAGAHAAADFVWAATTVAGLVPSSIWVVGSLRRREPGVDVVAVLALAGCLATRELLAGAVIAVMLASGRALESWAAGRARRELSALLSRVPRTVRRYTGDTVEVVDVDVAKAGDRLLVASGEVVPVDGILLQPATLDESALTGEPLPVERPVGDALRSGVVNSGPPFDLRAAAPAAESTYAGIVRLVEQAQAGGAPFVRMADRYAAAFVPLTLVVAALAWLVSGKAVQAVAVLVVATPCPLILAAPVALVGGLSQAARRGVVIKGGAALERLARGQVLLFDKTGTLTAGHPTVAQVVAAPGSDSTDVLRLAASLDQASPHPLAAAIVTAAAIRGLALTTPTQVNEKHGFGVEGHVGGQHVAVGKSSWLCPATAPVWVRRLQRRSALDSSILILVSIDDRLSGGILLDDPLRSDAPRTLRALRAAGVGHIMMVTGDRADVADAVGRALGVDEVLAERLPEEKLEAVIQARARGSVVMVGDGINDAPALAAADVGVALGVRGATASSEAADVVLMVDRLDRLADAIAIARRARRIAWQSVLGGMGLTGVAMAAAAFGLLTPTVGAITQEAIDVAAILSALRVVRAPHRAALAGTDAVLGRNLEIEHLALRPHLDDLRQVADRLDTGQPRTIEEVRLLHRWLVDDVLPHERREDTQLYPRLARVLGGSDPTGTLSRGHVEIEHHVYRLGRLVADIGDEPAEPDDIIEIRRVLYGLHAVLVLHFAQEEEGVFPLIEEPAAR